MKLSPFPWKRWADRLRGDASAPPFAKNAARRTWRHAGDFLLAVLTQSRRAFRPLMAPLGASCFLVFAIPERPFAQTRSLIGGHLVSSTVGLTMLAIAGPEGWGDSKLDFAPLSRGRLFVPGQQL